ncbi:cysteine desulfurase [Candidatus Dependentiae bacterium]|nr:cysteine desulfurase [Candidatus Dependentiae bacterium]
MFKKLRADFPFFTKRPELTYLDNAATTQKPQAVIDAITNFYARDNAPVHRGIYTLAEEATVHYEQARSTIAHYLGALPQEIVFTGGTTEGINFVAYAWGQKNLHPGDEIIVSELEHHSNLVPWIRLCQEKQLVLKYIPVTPEGDLDYSAYADLLSTKTKLVACTAQSNALGTAVNLPAIIKPARAYGAKILIDAAQIVGRTPINLRELDIDFLVFSGHKMTGPTGIGVLYINKKIQEHVEPYQVGGGMVFSVGSDHATWLKSPAKYEAGTPPIAQALGLAAAFNYLHTQVDFEKLKEHEAELTRYALTELLQMPTIRVLGPQEQLAMQGHMVSFASTKYHAHDIAAYLDTYGICVRAGHHCAQPLHKKLGIESSTRLSFYLYTTQEEVERCIYYLKKLF